MKRVCPFLFSLLFIPQFIFAGNIEFYGNAAISSSDLGNVEIRLTEQGEKLVPDEKGQVYQLDQVDTSRLSAESVAQIVRTISTFYQSRDILATRATVTREAFADSQKGGNLRVQIEEGRLRVIRVVAGDGNDVSESTRSRVLASSAAQVGGALDSSAIDHSILSMNRFAANQVQPVLFASPEGIVLEYRIQPGKKTSFDYTVDNFGSERTGDIRHSVNVTSKGLFNENDRASVLGMLTSGSASEYIRGEYFIPLGDTLQHRWSISAYHAAYTAENIGVTAFDFEGETNGAVLAYEHTLWSRDRRFIDLSMGVHILDASQDQSSVGIPSSSSGFLLPFIDLKISQQQQSLSWVAGIRFDINLPDLGSTGSAVELERLGRTNVVDDFNIVKLYAGLRTYLDPSRRVHELIANGSYEASLGGDRLPAQFLNTVGGHNTVRGYRVAVLSGDTSAHGQLEYRLHPLRYEPTTSNWDIALAAFLDAGMVENEDALPFEIDDTISSYGVGFHLAYGSRFKASVEYARTAMDLISPYDSVEAGDNELYVTASLRF